MLKRFLLFALVCTMAVSAQAQSLDGKWKTEEPKDEGKLDITLLISEPELNIHVAATIDNPEGTIVLSVSLPCSFSREGSKLFVKPRAEEAKVNLDKMEFKGELADSLEANPEMKAFLKSMVVATLDDKKKDLLKELSLEDVELEIVTQTDSTLCVRDDKGKEMFFTKEEE